MTKQNPTDRPNESQIVADAIAQFPKTFGLRAYPGKVFSISQSASYISDFPNPGTVYLYTAVQNGERWEAFCKGTPNELRAQIAHPVARTK
jgi:hypothetical protein